MNPNTLLPPWDARLPHDLRLFAERAILRLLGHWVRDYSTARFLSGNSGEERRSLGTAVLGPAAEPVVVEAFDGALLKYCASRGLIPRDSADAASACRRISEAAQEIVRLVPCCTASLTELVRTIHLIASAGEDYDSSHSDPAIPFSIFISVPSSTGRRSLLRVAEGLVHETMHLQLSLFESICPLVDESVDWTLHSPWKGTRRQTQGILHGLYVFAVLKWMWQHIRVKSEWSDDRDFSERRIQEISDDVEAVRGIIESPALTESGKTFVDALLRLAATQPTLNGCRG